MDILAHGAWSFLAAKTANMRKLEKPLRTAETAWWGIFPDVASFGPLVAYGIVSFVSGNRSMQALFGGPPDSIEPVTGSALPLADLTHLLYPLTHSFVIFFAVFFLVFLMRKKPRWELLGWGFHILLDIPTHSYAFYPTPAFWPLSDWKFDGVSWATTQFMIANYAALAACFFALYARRMVQRRRTTPHA